MNPTPPFVVILGYDEIAPATALAESLLGGGLDRSEIVIVFNPGPDEGGDLAAPVEVERLPENVGYAGGMNAGLSLALASGRATAALLTHDCDVTAGDLLVLSSYLAAHPEAAVAAPTLSWRDRPGIFSSGGFVGRRGPYHRQDAGPPGSARSVEWVDGAALVVRPTIVTSVGGFDDRFFMYVEDVDLGLRLTSRKWDVVVLADAHATKESSIPDRPAAYSYLRARNTVAMLAGLHRWVPLASFLGGLVVGAAPHLARAPELRGVRDAWAGRFGPPPPDLDVAPPSRG